MAAIKVNFEPKYYSVPISMVFDGPRSKFLEWAMERSRYEMDLQMSAVFYGYNNRSIGQRMRAWKKRNPKPSE